MVNPCFEKLRTSVVCELLALNRFIMAPLVQPPFVISFKENYILPIIVYNITKELEHLYILNTAIQIITNKNVQFIILQVTKVLFQATVTSMYITDDMNFVPVVKVLRNIVQFLKDIYI